MTRAAALRSTPFEIRQYIDQFASSILVRVKLSDVEGWQDLSIHALRQRDPREAERVIMHLIEEGTLPHRVKVV